MNQSNVQNGRISKAEQSRRSRIALEFGGSFTYARLPEGPRSWFEIENRGEPFDRQFAENVRRALGK